MAPWKTETVSLMLTGILKENAWDRLPILADALEDAGYDDPQVLVALRQEPSPLAGQWMERVILGTTDYSYLYEAVEALAELADYHDLAPPDAPVEPTSSRDVRKFLLMMELCGSFFETGSAKLATPEDLMSNANLWEHYETLTGFHYRPEPDWDPRWGDDYDCSC